MLLAVLNSLRICPRLLAVLNGLPIPRRILRTNALQYCELWSLPSTVPDAVLYSLLRKKAESPQP